jgi:4,5-DOPA dioxygenase extradiol
MPVLFLGHGSPMNAIEKNAFSDAWIALGKTLPQPQAILCISAHWFTRGTRINDLLSPKMVYDMYGFPDALYEVAYPASGAPEVARQAARMLVNRAVIDNTWGLDHGSWSLLLRLFPDAEIPVFQVSVDATAPAEEHFALGKALRPLRDQDVLILGSGNVVHNLRMVDWNLAGGFDWAQTFDAYIQENVISRSFDNVLQFQRAGSSARLSVPTPDHFFPLLSVLGASDPSDAVHVLTEACVLGSLSMTGYLFQ